MLRKERERKTETQAMTSTHVRLPILNCQLCLLVLVFLEGKASGGRGGETKFIIGGQQRWVASGTLPHACM